MTKSLERLSTGYRINRAADDAAGLAISEKMRAQIKGLNQAIRNANDGISMIQTAEGALGEVQSILQRMRELTVQATSETNTPDDRAEIQKEIEQLKSEIDRISDNSEFNGIKLLNGSLGAQGSSDAPAKVDALSVTGLKPGTYTVKITKAATNATLTSDVTYADDAAVNTKFDGTDKDITINGIQIDTTGVTSKATLLAAINARKSETGVEASWDTTNNVIILTATEYGSGHTITVGGTDKDLIVDTGMLTNGVDAQADVTFGNTTTSVTATGRLAIYNGAQLVLNGAVGDTANITVVKSGARLQIGANEDQEIAVDINEINTATLGTSELKVKDVSVLVTDNASQAITAIDAAIKQVSSERAKLGAFQNRLEHTITNLQVTAENLTAAESRIRDVDMAAEMANFTKQQVLQQAGVAMLAQANAQPQAILQLLR